MAEILERVGEAALLHHPDGGEQIAEHGVCADLAQSAVGEPEGGRVGKDLERAGLRGLLAELDRGVALRAREGGAHPRWGPSLETGGR